MVLRSVIIRRLFLYSTICIFFYIIVSMVKHNTRVDVKADEIKTESPHPRLKFHDSTILRNASLLHNPSHMCAKSRVFVMVYVHSAPVNIKRRMALRNTWANRNILEPLRVKVVFVMGIVDNATTMDAINVESEQYKDILQGDIIDDYKLLTIKALMSLTWLSENCFHANYILKTDDDIVVNIEMLTFRLRMLRGHNYETDDGLLLCCVWDGMGVIRDSNSKWYVSNTEFGEEIFPRYCSGMAFIMSPDVIDRLLIASKYVDFFWVDDVYLTGMVAAKAGVNHTSINKAYVLGDQLNEATADKTNSKLFYHCSVEKDFYAVWEKMHFFQQKIKRSLRDGNEINSILI